MFPKPVMDMPRPNRFIEDVGPTIVIPPSLKAARLFSLSYQREVSALVVASGIFEKGFDVTHSGSEMNDEAGLGQTQPLCAVKLGEKVKRLERGQQQLASRIQQSLRTKALRRGGGE